MARLLVPRTLIARIERFDLGKEFKGFASAVTNDEHPPRVYKASGISPVYLPYQQLGLHHHHLHRDGDPLLITQHIDDDIYGVALATHHTYFQCDKMEWLKANIEAIDWRYCWGLRNEVSQYNDPLIEEPGPSDDDDPGGFIPF
jgi:hypothetical protein